MKTITDKKDLEGAELVQVKAAGHNLLQIQVVEYNPRTKTGKFHHYRDYLISLELFKDWSPHKLSADVDTAAAAATSPTT